MAASARRHAPASAYTISTVPAPSRTAAEACIIQSCAPNIRSAATNSVSRSIQPRFIAPPTQASSISTTAADAKNTMRDAKPKRTARPAPIALDDKAQGRTAAGEARPFQARPLIERRDDQRRAPIAGIGEPAVEDQALFGQQPLRSACHRGEDAPHHQIACREHRHQAETGRLGLEPGNDLRRRAREARAGTGPRPIPRPSASHGTDLRFSRDALSRCRGAPPCQKSRSSRIQFARRVRLSEPFRQSCAPNEVFCRFSKWMSGCSPKRPKNPLHAKW
jgi:hypothetical protein